jgi:hypothetical protein
MQARAHVDLFLANSHCWAHFPEEVCGCNDLGPVVWGTSPLPLLTHLKTVRTYMFKNKFKRGPKADHRVQPEAVMLFSAVITVLASESVDGPGC